MTEEVSLSSLCWKPVARLNLFELLVDLSSSGGSNLLAGGFANASLNLYTVISLADLSSVPLMANIWSPAFAHLPRRVELCRLLCERSRAD
jgi:hypothetical protein